MTQPRVSTETIQRRKNDLLATTASARRQLVNVRNALEDLNGYTDGPDSLQARRLLREADAALVAIAQIADTWGAQR